MKVLLNKSGREFNLSPNAIRRLYELNGHKDVYLYEQFYSEDKKGYLKKLDENSLNLRIPNYVFDKDYGDKVELLNRHVDEHIIIKSNMSSYQLNIDDKIIQVVEEMGNLAFNAGDVYKLIEIPDDVEFSIQNNYGTEYVVESHRVWR